MEENRDFISSISHYVFMKKIDQLGMSSPRLANEAVSGHFDWGYDIVEFSVGGHLFYTP